MIRRPIVLTSFFFITLLPGPGRLLAQPYASNHSEDPKVLRSRWEQMMSQSEVARRSGDYAAAHADCDTALALAREFPAPDTHVAQTQVQIGNIYLSEHKSDAAEPFFKEAVRNCEVAVGPQSPILVTPLEGLANCYFAGSHFDQVAPVYQRIVEIAEHGVAVQNLELGRRLRNLADVYISEGDFARAEPLYLRAIGLAEPSGDITELVQSRLAAGGFYQSWKKWAPAVDQYRKAADLALGVENEFLSFQALQALTEALKEDEKFEQAEAAAQRAIALREKRSAMSENVDSELGLAVSLANLAQVYIAWSKPDRAETLYRRALEIVQKAAPASTEPFVYLVGLAGALRAVGHLPEAEKRYQEALVLLDKNGGSEVPAMTDLLDNYASVLLQLKRPLEAQSLLTRSETLRKGAKK